LLDHVTVAHSKRSKPSNRSSASNKINTNAWKREPESAAISARGNPRKRSRKMKLSILQSLGLVAFAAVGVTAQSSKHVENFKYKPREDPVPNQRTSQGCFMSQGSLEKTPITKKGADGKILVVTIGVCLDQCALAKKDVMAVHGTDCLCGDTYPPKEKRVDDKKCDTACFGFPEEPCGNIGDYDAWLVYNLGFEMNVKFDEEATTTTSSAPSSSKTGSDTEKDTTTKESATTDPNSPNTSDDSSSSEKEEKKDGPNVAGIAAGVVVGVVVIAAVVGGGFFFLRRRRNAEIEEEHRRNAAVNAFISGAKPPSSSGGLSMSDSRLEPGLAHRRLSDGSIADNQDYSRKILRVTNA
jgi:cell wall integrity and stress response component